MNNFLSDPRLIEQRVREVMAESDTHPLTRHLERRDRVAVIDIRGEEPSVVVLPRMDAFKVAAEHQGQDVKVFEKLRAQDGALLAVWLGLDDAEVSEIMV